MSKEIISFIDFTNMSDEEKYKLLNSKDDEIERLHSIIKEVREEIMMIITQLLIKQKTF